MSSPVLSTRVLPRLLASAAIVAGLAACDPLYGVGSRQYLAPAHPSIDSASVAGKGGNATPALDVRHIADCLETALRSTPSVSDVRRWREPESVAASQAGMSFALGDSALGSRPRYANLYLGTRNSERPALDVEFNWIGMAGKVPTQEQEAMVRASTALVRQLRAACLPDVAEAVECVAGVLGRKRVCRSAR
jgi:hypothetical protein